MSESDKDMRNRGTSHRDLTTSPDRVARRVSSCTLAGAMTKLVALLALVMLAAPALAATVWLDSDGDGLPQQGGLLAVSNGANLTLDVWMNSGSFQWTNYLLYVQWDGCMNVSNPEYVIGGGTAFEIDDFSLSSGIGFGGFGFNGHGSNLVGRIKVRVDSPNGCCIKPITEADDYSVFSQLGTTGDSYRLFDDTDGLCFESLDSRREQSWGGVKGLYK
jgi:hypothetical protein